MKRVDGPLWLSATSPMFLLSIGVLQSVLGRRLTKKVLKGFAEIGLAVETHIIGYFRYGSCRAKQWFRTPVQAIVFKVIGRGPSSSSLIHRGGQEKGVRPGTVNVPGAVGFGKACSLLFERREQDNAHIKNLRDTLLKSISDHIDGVHFNGPMDLRHPGNINLRIEGVRSERLIAQLPYLMLSNTSACTGGARVSHVLQAIGLDDNQAEESFRIGIGKNNTFEEINQASDMIIQEVNRVRKQTLVLN